MWQIRKPTLRQIQDAHQSQLAAPFSYAEQGASLNDSPVGYDVDFNTIALGKGKEVYERACSALARWAMFPPSWTEVHPAKPGLAVGTSVVVVFRLFGLWWTNVCRIVYVLDEPSERRRFGFAYGTLPMHVELGEERFTVEWKADDTVWYEIRAFSRPRYWLTRLAYPLARMLQRRFVCDSKACMLRAASDPNLGGQNA